MTRDNVLFWNWYILRVKENSSHAHKKPDFGTSFKISDEHRPPSYIYENPPGGASPSLVYLVDSTLGLP